MLKEWFVEHKNTSAVLLKVFVRFVDLKQKIIHTPGWRNEIAKDMRKQVGTKNFIETYCYDTIEDFSFLYNNTMSFV